jgi:hypothetical protein
VRLAGYLKKNCYTLLTLYRVLYKPKQAASRGYHGFPFSVCDLVSTTKPGRVFMKFRIGALINKLCWKRELSTSRLSDTHISRLLTSLNTYLPLLFTFIDLPIWVKFDTGDLHVTTPNTCEFCANRWNESYALHRGRYTYLTLLSTFLGRDSSVGIATRYGMDGPGIEHQ